MVSVPSSSSVGHSADFARVTCLHQGPPSPPPALATLSPFTLHQNFLLTLVNLQLTLLVYTRVRTPSFCTRTSYMVGKDCCVLPLCDTARRADSTMAPWHIGSTHVICTAEWA